MAFGGVLLFAGILSALMFAMIGSLLAGVLLLIAAIVFGVLYHRSAKNGEEPKRWQKITAIVCAAVGAVLTATPFVVWMILVVVSNS